MGGCALATLTQYSRVELITNSKNALPGSSPAVGESASAVQNLVQPEQDSEELLVDPKCRPLGLAFTKSFKFRRCVSVETHLPVDCSLACLGLPPS